MHKHILIALAILMTSGLAQADRSKFLLAGGLGFGINSLSSENNGSETDYDSDAGLVTSFKIGGVVDQQHAIYYHRQASWFSFDNNATTGNRAISGIMGVGYTYYVEPTVGSPYVEASIGLGDFVDVDGEDVYTGTALLVGAGYELSEHIQVGGTITVNSTESSDNPDVTVNHRSIAAKVEFKL